MVIKKKILLLIIFNLFTSSVSFACFGGDETNFLISFKPVNHSKNLLVVLNSPSNNETYILEDDTGYLGTYFTMVYMVKKNKGNQGVILDRDRPNLSFMKERLQYIEENIQDLDVESIRKDEVLKKIAILREMVSVKNSTYLELVRAFLDLDYSIRKNGFNPRSKIKTTISGNWQKNGTQYDFSNMVNRLGLPELLDSRSCSSGISELNLSAPEAPELMELPTFDFSAQ